MAYVEPKLEVVEALQSGDVVRIVGRFDRLTSPPLAPAGLYTDPKSASERYALHRAVAQQGQLATFETYGPQSRPLPRPGDVLFYRPWWVPEAMDAALDTTASWIRKRYPDNGDHDHCLFTWETISSYEGNREGYWSEKYGWITVEAYENFIAKDIYRLRSRNDGA